MTLKEADKAIEEYFNHNLYFTLDAEYGIYIEGCVTKEGAKFISDTLAKIKG